MWIAAATVVVIASAGGEAVWASSAQHALPHGTNFVIHLITDPNFCLESEGDGRIIVSQCAIRDNQHFTFTNNATKTSGANTNVIVDGFGLCLDRGNGKPGTALTSVPCNFGAKERFVYTATGKLQQPGGTSCVAAVTAAQNAAVFDQTCSGAKDVKIFQLSH